jgi:hypothetical protein
MGRDRMKNYILVLKHDYPEPRIVTKYRAEEPKIWPGLWGTGITVELPESVDPDCVTIVHAPDQSPEIYYTNGELIVSEQPLIPDPNYVAELIVDPSWEFINGMYVKDGVEIEEAPMIASTEPAPLIPDPSFTIVSFLQEVGDGFFVSESQELKDQKAAKIAKEAQEKINAEARAFLAASDYIVIRAMERGQPLSAEFKAERDAARDRVVDVD